jgi:hypothetical protein
MNLPLPRTTRRLFPPLVEFFHSSPFPKGGIARTFRQNPKKLSSLGKREERRGFWEGFFKMLRG